MILVCPSCKANFKVPDGAIPPEGRKVRCAKCKHSWHATPNQALKPKPAARPQSPATAGAMAGIAGEMDAGMAARTVQLRRELGAGAPSSRTAPPPADDESFDEEDGFMDRPAASREVEDFEESEGAEPDDFGVGAALRSSLAEVSDELDALSDESYGGEDAAEEDEDAYDDDDFLARRRAEQRRQYERDAQVRMRRSVVAGWGVLLVAILSLLYIVAFERVALVEKWPASQVLYHWLDSGRDIDRLRPDDGRKLTKPITEEEVKLSASLDEPKVEQRDGKMVLVLNGYVVNEGNRAANVPKLQIDITDGSGKVLDSWTFDPPGLVLRRGSRLPFEQTRSPIPIGAARAEVKVLDGTKSTTSAE